MANITFLIGNGFDLACGLKSRYSDTYDEYVTSKSDNGIIEQFKKTIEKNISTWADFEMKLAEYAYSFKNESELAKCICDYKEFLNSYLVQQQSQFLGLDQGNDIIASAVRRETARSLYSFFDGVTQNNIRAISSAISDGWPRKYQFISFNYTTVFDKLVKEAFSKGGFSQFDKTASATSVIHIHGKINNDLILGIDNESQINNLPYCLSKRGKRNIIKPFFLDQYDDKRKQDAIDYINTSNVICVYGMALGDSDLTWRKAIAEWISGNEKRQLIYYKHSLACKKYPTTATTQKMDDEEDYKEVLIKLLFGDIVDAALYEKIIKQIHIPMGSNIFKIKEIKDNARIEYKNKLESTQNRPKENVS